MAVFQSPFGGVTVEVVEGNESAYRAAGWPLAGTPKVEAKYVSQMNKGELIEHANTLGLDADDSLSKKDLVELIEAAESEKK